MSDIDANPTTFMNGKLYILTHVVADVILLLKEIRKIGMTNCIKTDGHKENSIFNVKRVKRKRYDRKLQIS